MPAPKLLSTICCLMSLCSVAGLAGCQPVPLSGSSAQREQRPVKPLYDRPVSGTIQDGRKKSGFQVVAPNAKPRSAAASKAAPGAPVDVSQQLADAADKAASAESLAQFAQTKDDWNVVFDRWKRALQILKSAPTQTPAIKQKIAAYSNGLEQATRDAQISMNPSLAPVDPKGSRATKSLIGGGGTDPAAKSTEVAKPGDKSADKPADPAAAGSPAPIAGSPTPAASASPKPP
jgi:hypothetical protein